MSLDLDSASAFHRITDAEAASALLASSGIDLGEDNKEQATAPTLPGSSPSRLHQHTHTPSLPSTHLSTSSNTSAADDFLSSPFRPVPLLSDTLNSNNRLANPYSSSFHSPLYSPYGRSLSSVTSSPASPSPSAFLMSPDLKANNGFYSQYNLSHPFSSPLSSPLLKYPYNTQSFMGPMRPPLNRPVVPKQRHHKQLYRESPMSMSMSMSSSFRSHTQKSSSSMRAGHLRFIPTSAEEEGEDEGEDGSDEDREEDAEGEHQQQLSLVDDAELTMDTSTLSSYPSLSTVSSDDGGGGGASAISMFSSFAAHFAATTPSSSAPSPLSSSAMHTPSYHAHTEHSLESITESTAAKNFFHAASDTTTQSSSNNSGLKRSRSNITSKSNSSSTQQTESSQSTNSRKRSRTKSNPSPIIKSSAATSMATDTTTTNPRPPARVQKGLRHFSVKVCEKVEQQGVTTYNHVADELVKDLAANDAVIEEEEEGGDTTNLATAADPLVVPQKKKKGYDEKNIRRRVYDALNVLMAMGIIQKDKKQITWIGLPTGVNEHLHKAQALKQARLDSIREKRQQLQELLVEIVSIKNVRARNEKRWEEYRTALQMQAMEQQKQMSMQSCSTTAGTTFTATTTTDSDAKDSPSTSSVAGMTPGVQVEDAALLTSAALSLNAATFDDKDQIPLRFVLIKTPAANIVHLSVSPDQNELHCEISGTFLLHDSAEVLREMGMAEVEGFNLPYLIPREICAFYPDKYIKKREATQQTIATAQQQHQISGKLPAGMMMSVGGVKR